MEQTEFIVSLDIPPAWSICKGWGFESLQVSYWLILLSNQPTSITSLLLIVASSSLLLLLVLLHTESEGDESMPKVGDRRSGHGYHWNYHGRKATISSKTRKRYYIKLSSGNVEWVMKSSVARRSPSATGWQQHVLEKLRLIRQNMAALLALLSQLKL